MLWILDAEIKFDLIKWEQEDDQQQCIYDNKP